MATPYLFTQITTTMKRLLLTALVGLLWLNSYSQKIDSTFHDFVGIFNQNSQQIIKNQNSKIASGMFETTLYAVEPEPDGGFMLHYNQTVSGFDSSEAYVFNKQKMCVQMILIQDLKNRDEQIEYFLSHGFYRKSPYVYYSKLFDLMVKVNFNEKFVSFIYSNKPYNPIKKK